MALDEKELDFGYAEGFLNEWLKNAPAQVKEHLSILVAAINFYKDKLADAEADLRDANDKYIVLTAQAAQYLELMSQQKELIDQNLIENQREFHTKEKRATTDLRIIWHNEAFQAELTPGEQWRTDMEAVKAAGFRCTGPPSWQWYTSKASALNKLRTNRPPSGLTLTEVALKQYNHRNEQELKKAEVKKQFATASKKAKKLSKDPSVSGLTELVIPEGKYWVSAEDLPAWVSRRKEPERKSLTETLGRCIMCDELLYIYEGSTACLWCQKEGQ